MKLVSAVGEVKADKGYLFMPEREASMLEARRKEAEK